ncbi:MAG: pyridoxamine 5'-phosphate oxidase family protein [Desulfobacteraceae bacterium]|nr:pyridoxamine 5'-phosphate oxidase family protein [Desulfobacteraceae bacterium]
MNIKDHWNEIRQLFKKALKTNKYYSFASVDKEGNPHITPIGSLILRDDCTGYFSEKFPEKSRQNYKTNDRVAVMAINSGFFFWFKSIRKGVFKSLPGVRIYGRVGKRRKATEKERAKWLNIVKIAKGTKGYNLLWKDMAHVRDIHFDDARPVKAGVMTQDCMFQNMKK